MAAMLVMAGVPRAAQAENWQNTASLYLWLPKTTTDLETANGTVSSEISASDVLSNLDFGFMGDFEARKGR